MVLGCGSAAVARLMTQPGLSSSVIRLAAAVSAASQFCEMMCGCVLTSAAARWQKGRTSGGAGTCRCLLLDLPATGYICR
jgi:hypothetical protein